MNYDEDRFRIDTMLWSFSRLNNYDSDCKCAWHLKYIERLNNTETAGFFSAYGSFCHEILEKYFKKELNIFNIAQYYKDNFSSALPMNAPPNKYVDIKDSYYQKGLEYFENFGFDEDRYEILGVEKKVEFEIEGYPFVGYIDLLCRDKKDEKIVLIDHKSASINILKSGKVAKKDQHHFLEFKRQQYLYSKPIIEEYGEVKKLRWNMFKDNRWLGCKWDKDEYEEALNWAVDTIHRIEEEKEWPMKEKLDFFCFFICDCKGNCPLWLESREHDES